MIGCFPRLEERAEEELGETPQVRTRTLKELNQLLDDYGLRDEFEEIRHLDDAFLLRFLRVAKFDVEKAVGRVKRYFEGRIKYEEDFRLMNVEETVDMIRKGVVQMLPTLTSRGRIVVVLNLRPWDTKIIHFNQIFRSIIMSLENLLELPDFPEFQILGLEVLFDTTGFSARHFLQLSPASIMKFVVLLLKMLPLRIRFLHIISESRFFKTTFNIGYPFLPKKLKERLTIHSDYSESLDQMLDPSIRPKELGGTGKPMDIEYWIDRMYELNNYPRKDK